MTKKRTRTRTKKSKSKGKGKRKQSSYSSVSLRTAPKHAWTFISGKPLLVGLTVLVLLIAFGLGGVLGGLLLSACVFILTPLVYYKVGRPIYQKWKKIFKV